MSETVFAGKTSFYCSIGSFKLFSSTYSPHNYALTYDRVPKSDIFVESISLAKNNLRERCLNTFNGKIHYKLVSFEYFVSIFKTETNFA